MIHVELISGTGVMSTPRFIFLNEDVVLEPSVKYTSALFYTLLLSQRPLYHIYVGPPVGSLLCSVDLPAECVANTTPS